jgi:serine/threonine protein kinase/Tol biopolymer transport system component
MLGQIISHYRILEKIGAGGMGVVYRAEDLKLGRQVALKFLPQAVPDPETLARFEREARAAAAISHPNICTVHEVGEHQGKPFLAMELLEGATLKQRIGGAPVPIDLLLGWSVQVAEGLEAAHAQGFAHRDIKSANLFVTQRGQVKILDFGLAKQVAPRAAPGDIHSDDTADSAAGRSSPGGSPGTPGYMSPEQACGAELDTRTDLFSVGVVLYEMATGRLPFQGRTTAAVMGAVVREEPTPPSQLNPLLPEKLSQIVARALEKSVELRYQHASDLRADLKRVQRDLNSGRSQPVSTSVTGPTLRLRRPLGWRPLAGGVALAFAAIAAVLVRPLPPPRVGASVQLADDSLPKWHPLLTDGSRVFFSSGLGAEEVIQLSVRGGDPARVPLMPGGAKLIHLSADGAELLVGRLNGADPTGGIWELWSVPLLGSAPRRLGDLRASDAAAAWSADGRQLVYAFDKALHLARSDGSDPRKLADVPGAPRYLRWSPDGTAVRFTMADPGRGGKPSQWEASVANGAVRPLLVGWEPTLAATNGNWSPDGRWFVFTASDGGLSSIWAIRESPGLHLGGRGPFQLTSGPMSSYLPVFSPNGRTLFINGYQDRRELLRFDSQSGQLTPLLKGLSATQLEYSKDGRWAAWVSVPDSSLWVGDPEGNQRRQLTSPPLKAQAPHWSPDGRQIAFFGGPPGQPTRLYVAPVESGPVVQVSHGEGGALGDAWLTWSPDGTSLVFGSMLPAAKESRPLIVVDLATGSTSTLPGSEGLWAPRWSPDGQLVAAFAAESMALRLFDPKSREQTMVTTLKGGWPGWSRDGRFLYFQEAATPRVWKRLRAGDRKVEELIALKNLPVATDGWFAPGLDDSLMTSRAIGTDAIYALDFHP